VKVIGTGPKKKFIERRTGSMIRDLRKVVDDEAR
jgi:hypothetical protein